MPHTTIQYSKHFEGFDFKPLLLTIANAYVLHCKAAMASTVGYTSLFDDVLVAGIEGDDRAVIWIQLRMKSGRDQEQKNALMLAVHDAVDQFIKPYAAEKGLFCEPRIELTELSPDYISMGTS